jgi:uncharacterized protein YciI
MTLPSDDCERATNSDSVAGHTLVLYALRQRPDLATANDLMLEHLAHLRRLHHAGQVLLAGPFAGEPLGVNGGFALFRSPDADVVQAFVDEDPAVGRIFTATVRQWVPVVGQERLPGPGDSGKITVEDTLRRLFVDGVSARDAAAYFDRTYHDDTCIHEAPSLPYGGDYYGLDGAARHAVGFTKTWDRWQTSEQRELHPRIIATDTEAVVLWTLRGPTARGSGRIQLPRDQPLPVSRWAGYRVPHVLLRHRCGARLSHPGRGRPASLNETGCARKLITASRIELMKYYSIRLLCEANQLPSRCDDESSTKEQLAPSSSYRFTRRAAGPTVAEPIVLWQPSWGRPRSWPPTQPGCRIDSPSSNRAASTRV